MYTTYCISIELPVVLATSLLGEAVGTLGNCFASEMLCYTGIFHWILCFVMENFLNCSLEEKY